MAVQAAPKGKPNILVIFGDDIGLFDISAYSRGATGFLTPHIDRIGSEGGVLVTYYGQPNCTAGRAAFITGQCPFRTGLIRVGLPAVPLGLHPNDPTLAQFLKPLGYLTAHFGKSHLGDDDEFLPTRHGFDEFFGNLYELQVEDQAQDFPKEAAFQKKFGPRGVLRSTTGGIVEDTGALTRSRMETVDEEFLAAAEDFIKRSHKAGKPFFCWFNTTRMNAPTHLKPASAGKTGLGIQGNGMVEHDGMVGELLRLLDELKISGNTIIIYTTDNGPPKSDWPDAGASPYRSEANTSSEGLFRVPALIRWPGHIKPGANFSGLFSAEDWLPTLVAAAGGDATLREDALKGFELAGRTVKVHLDGCNQLPYLTGAVPSSARHEFFYFGEDGKLLARRDDQYKFNFTVPHTTEMAVNRNPINKLQAPQIIDLKIDPFENAPGQAQNYDLWFTHHAHLIVPAVSQTVNYLETYRKFPPRQPPPGFSLDQMINKVRATAKDLREDDSKK